MSIVDVMIPLIGGMLMAAFRQLFVRSDAGAVDAAVIKKRSTCRKSGFGLIAISVAYALMAYIR